jgi:putative membrane protein
MFGRGYNGLNNCFRFGYGFMNGSFGMVMMLAFVVLTVIAIIYFVKRTGNNSGSNAMEELKMRFARGEISEEEFLKKKNILK